MRSLTRALALLLAVLCAASLGGCVSVSINDYGATGTVQGKGELVTVDFPVGAFSQVDIRNSLDVVYKNGPCSVQMKLHKNLAEYMEVSVEDDILTVNSTKRFSVGGGQHPVLYITAPSLSAMYLSGSVDLMESDTISGELFYLELAGSADLILALDVDALEISSSGSADLELSGRADSLSVRSSGASKLSALALETKVTSMILSGATDATVSCSETLDVVISGSGSVRYRGNPTVKRNIAGVGDLRQIAE